MLTCDSLTGLETASQLVSVPRGFRLKLVWSYHDALGRRFSSVRGHVVVRPSRYDLVRAGINAEDFLLTVKADNVGQVVLHIHDQVHNGLDTYLLVDVEDVIRPSHKDAVVGDVICYSTDLIAVGKWFASEPKLIDIDPKMGLALVLTTGSSKIMYELFYWS